MLPTAPKQLDQKLAGAREIQERPRSRERDEESYGQILKSTAWIGGSSVMTLGVGMIRNKAMALLLGPSGFGVMATFGSIIELAVVLANFGIDYSGVRQIAESAASNNTSRIASTVAVTRRTLITLAIIGALSVWLLSPIISYTTFGSPEYATAIAVLGLAAAFRSLAAGYGALLQGLRRIRDMAVVGILASAIGTAGTIVIVLFFGEAGLAPSLVAGAAAGFAATWWYTRKIRLPHPAQTRTEVATELRGLLSLGFVFMASGLVVVASGYAVRALVFRTLGVDAAGYYAAAYTLGSLYVGVILGALGADFYPRLVSLVTDNSASNRLVNQQIHVTVLLAAPGLLATLAFAPVIIQLFYSSKFNAATEVLRWMCLGAALRVLSWPLGFLVLAKNNKLMLFSGEFIWAAVNVGLTWPCLQVFQVTGAGIAFFWSYIFHFLLNLAFARALSDFRFSPASARTSLLYASSVAALMVSSQVFPFTASAAIGAVLAILWTIYSTRVLLDLISIRQLPGPVQLVLHRLGYAIKEY